MKVLKLSVLMFLGIMTSLFAQEPTETNQDLFKFFGDRSGNEFRSASGKPGHNYWQNSADYKINVTLDEENEMINGNISIEYTNNSPEALDKFMIEYHFLNKAKIVIDTLKLPIPHIVSYTKYPVRETVEYNPEIVNVLIQLKRRMSTTPP